MFDPLAALGAEWAKDAEPDPEPVAAVVVQVDPSRPVDLDDVRERLRALRNDQTKNLIRRVLAKEPPAEPPEARHGVGLSRYEAWRAVTGALAGVADGWEDSGALLSILEPAWRAECAASPEDFTPWERVENLLESARAGMPALKAQREAQRQADLSAFRRMVGHGAREPRSAPAAEGEPVPEPEPEKADEWAQCLDVAQKKGKDPHVVSSELNLTRIFAACPAWRGAFRFNEMSLLVEVGRCPLLAPGELTRPLAEADATKVEDWLEDKIGVPWPIDVVRRHVVSAAHTARYDPLREYLLSRQRVGHHDYCSEFFEEYLGAETVDEEGRDITEHVRRISRRWLVGLVARALEPGCKLDTVLILESPKQGLKKSSGLGALCAPWFSDTAIRIGEKDTYQAAVSTWLIEIPEAVSVRQSELDQQKAFFSEQYTSFREPYGRAVRPWPRRCVFAITTNETRYLSDLENRRFWPLRVRGTRRRLLRQHRHQIFAHAVQVYQEAFACPACLEVKPGDWKPGDIWDRCAEHRWWLEGEEEVEGERIAAQRVLADVIGEQIECWFLEQAPERRPRQVRLSYLLKQFDEGTGTWQQRRMAQELRRLGFRLERTMHSRAWTTPQRLLDAPIQSRGAGPTATQVAEARGISMVKPEVFEPGAEE